MLTLIAKLLYFSLCVVPIAMAGWFGPRSGDCSCCGDICSCFDADYGTITVCTDYPASKIVKINGISDELICGGGICDDLDNVNIVMDGGGQDICGAYSYPFDTDGGNCGVQGLTLRIVCVAINMAEDKAKWSLDLLIGGCGYGGGSFSWDTPDKTLPFSCVGAEPLTGTLTAHVGPFCCAFDSATAEIIS